MLRARFDRIRVSKLGFVLWLFNTALVAIAGFCNCCVVVEVLMLIDLQMKKKRCFL